MVLGRGGYLTPGLVRLDQRVRTANQVVRTLRDLVPELDDARLERVRTAFAEQLGPEAPESAIGLVPNLAASRVANRLDLRGPAYTVDAACASSLVAVDHAVRELDSGRCDVVLAGGVHHCHDITLWSVFSQLGALSRSGRIRPHSRVIDDDLTALTRPLLAIFGDESGLSEQAPSLEAALADCRTVILPNQGHSVLVERPHETRELLLDWVRAHHVVAGSVR